VRIMSNTTSPKALGPSALPESSEKRLMALDALSNLTREFARHPDVERLLELAILTLSGQFSVTGAFALLVSPAEDEIRVLRRATGKFTQHPLIDLIAESLDGIRVMMQDGEPHTMAELREKSINVDFVNTLEIATVRVMIPLIHENRLIGLIGLGPRVGNRPFLEHDLDLLGTLAGTLSPLLMNSVLFGDIARLKTWYLDILNSVRQCVFVFDSEYRLKKLNNSGRELMRLAYGSDRRIPPNGRLISDVFDTGTFPRWAHKIMLTDRQASPGFVDPLRLQIAGREYIYQAQLSRAAGQTAEASDFIVTLDDITGQTQQEQRLFDLQRLAEQGMMAASIAHELNNFLALIMAGAEMARLAIDRKDMERAVKSLEKLRNSASSMGRFTAGLTDYSRQRRQVTEGQMNDMAADVLSFVAVQRRFRGIALESDFGSDMAPFPFDPDQISQVLLNLVNNAADAIAETEREDGRITIQTWQDGAMVILQVTDNGSGVPEANRHVLFKERHTTKDKGHGYGLVTCGKIVAEHGGEIRLEKTSCSGSTIQVELPKAGPPSISVSS
jgi:two-component system NtrC family sensor kinase